MLGFAGLGVWQFLRPKYEYVHPKRGAITEAIYGLGKVRAERRFEVKVGILSAIQQLFVREGDKVKAGNKLILFDSGVLFRAPFDGTVTLSALQKGETALPQIPILRLEDLTDRYIEVSVEQQGALRVKPGQKARVSFESVRGDVLNGRVRALFPREDEFLVHIEVDNFPGNVLPGMTADISIEVGQIPDALLIPLASIRSGAVTVRRDGHKEKVQVEIGHVDGLWAEVRGSALSESDEVLVMKVDK